MIITPDELARLYPEMPDDSDPVPTFLNTIRPSARTIATTDAADALRYYVDTLKLEHRLTSAELAVILTGELTRAARSDLEYERATGRTAPLALRFIKPASEDAAVADADLLANAIIDTALTG